jgi:CheY-specific phosphatase CheX
MFVERSEATAQIQELAALACVELMKAYEVALEPSEAGWTESDEVMLSGVMGFIGDKLRGTCLLAASQAIVQAAAPAGGLLRDWVGELANQLVGRLKSKLMARGTSIGLSTPVVLSGVRLSPLPRTGVDPVVFRAEMGRVLVWVEVEVDRDFELGEERALKATEGELLVF